MHLGKLLCAGLIVVGAGAASAESFDNRSVLALHQAGLGDEAIVAKVGTMPCGYDVSTDGLIGLKKAGISDQVIAAMVGRCTSSNRAQGLTADSADPSAHHAPGIYSLVDTVQSSRMTLMRPSKASGIKVTGNGSVLFPFVGKLVLPDASSRNVIKSARPTFFFYFDPGDEKVSDFGTPTSIAAQSPEEFTLVRFKAKASERQVDVGRMSAFGTRRGIATGDSISFVSDEIGDSAFKVTFSEPLAPGEYGFVLTGQNNAARVYDFTIG